MQVLTTWLKLAVEHTNKPFCRNLLCSNAVRQEKSGIGAHTSFIKHTLGHIPQYLLVYTPLTDTVFVGYFFADTYVCCWQHLPTLRRTRDFNGKSKAEWKTTTPHTSNPHTHTTDVKSKPLPYTSISCEGHLLAADKNDR